MDFNKVSEHHILHIVMAITAFVVAVAVRFICISRGCDAGTSNLIFVIVLGIEAVLYLLLMKTIINQIEKLMARKKNKKEEKLENTSIQNENPIEESVHDRIVREKFEQSIIDFCNYTQKVLGKYISAEELKTLNTYIELFAREQPFDNINQIPPRQLSNNDLYHYGWNLWNHFKKNRQDQHQECVVSWLKAVFSNLNEVEFSTIKGKLTIFDSKCKISIQKNIPDYLRFLKE